LYELASNGLYYITSNGLYGLVD